MANRQTIVVGALGVLVGMVIGAGSAQRADIVSYSGSNPNADNGSVERRVDGILRQRSNEAETRLTAPRRTDFTENVSLRRMLRLSDLIHMAAPTRTVRGAPAQQVQRVPGCDQYSGQRYTHCLEAVIQGEPYEANYYPTSY